MDPKPDLEVLLDRYLQGLCTPEEEALLERFFEQSGQPEKEIRLSGDDKERMFAAFKASPRFTPKRRAIIWQAAAAAVLLLSLGLWLWQEQTHKVIAYKQISCPKGNLLKVVLPDSSVVMLNANSTLRYAASFNENRTLELKGEGLFTVTKDDEHPFIIHTAGDIATKVLGTQFTIRSYDDLPETRVIVVSGRVQVKHASTILGTVEANEEVTYNRQDGDHALNTVADADKLSGWTKGEWEYENMSVQELKSLLLNYYNINIVTTRPFVADADMNFTNRQSAEDIINIFCITANCHYKWLNHATVEVY